ncbi:hypothetical protein G6O69_20125 [Pseudenhygromyxa sp. WMMC2535]|nr:TfuA-like protein [Pseudenhygromyxa sp. WMMC2535]NVB40165.1 hypothetical protein [Pseudenhygromyxa sp. WMMC2535]
MGDVYRALRRRPRAIVIIDGLFEQTPSVWHKELLLALSRGVWVYGAASMGALRACELDGFGMIGVGSIYARFRAGELDDDDEVAVSHGSAESGWRPLSEAMVNLRDGLAAARDDGLIDAHEHDALITAAKRRFYPERSWGQTLIDARERGLKADRCAELRALVRSRAPGTKAADARAGLERVAADLAAGRLDAPHEPSFRLEHAAVMTTLLDETSLPPDALAADPRTRHRSSARSLGRMVRATHAERDGLYAEALHRLLLAAEGLRAGFYTDWIDAYEDLGAQGEQLDDPELRARVEARTLALERHLRAVHGAQVDLFLPHALAARGQLELSLDDLRAAWSAVNEHELVLPTAESLGLSPAELYTWYGERFGLLASDPRDHASAVGLPLPELLLEAGAQLLRERGSPAHDHPHDPDQDETQEDPPC